MGLETILTAKHIWFTAFSLILAIMIVNLNDHTNFKQTAGND